MRRNIGEYIKWQWTIFWDPKILFTLLFCVVNSYDVVNLGTLFGSNIIIGGQPTLWKCWICSWFNILILLAEKYQSRMNCWEMLSEWNCDISVWVFWYFNIKNFTFVKTRLDLGSICVWVVTSARRKKQWGRRSDLKNIKEKACLIIDLRKPRTKNIRTC